MTKSTSSDKLTRPKAAGDTFKRDKATIKRIAMYRGGKPHRDKEGKILGGEFMSKDRAGGKEVVAETGRIAPDRRWFGNTRVVSATQLDRFRAVMAAKAADPYSVVLHSKALPMGLLVDTKTQRRSHLVSAEPFADTFGVGAQRKRPKIAASDVAELAAAAAGSSAAFEEGGAAPRRVRPRAVGEVIGSGAGDEGDITSSGVRDGRREDVFNKGTSKRIWGELYKVLDCSDVVVQVLDARDPMGTRSAAVEKHLKDNARHKTLILVLNKVDLVPTWVTRRWVAALSREAPTLAFTAGNLTKPFGKGSLIALLRQLSKLHTEKKAISVGFIGYPNVGKSSIINALKGTKACKVAPVPGETKVWQYVTLMKRCYLIDCPGTVHMESSLRGTGSNTGAGLLLSEGAAGAAGSGSGAAAGPSTLDADAELVLKGVVRAERLASPEMFVEAVLSRVKRAHVTAMYGITEWRDAADFLVQAATRQGRLHKGGEPDVAAVAVNMVNDWQRGRLPYFTLPPELGTAVTTTAGEAAAAVGGVPANASAPKVVDNNGGRPPRRVRPGAALSDAGGVGVTPTDGDESTIVGGPALPPSITLQPQVLERLGRHEMLADEEEGEGEGGGAEEAPRRGKKNGKGGDKALRVKRPQVVTAEEREGEDEGDEPLEAAPRANASRKRRRVEGEAAAAVAKAAAAAAAAPAGAASGGSRPLSAKERAEALLAQTRAGSSAGGGARPAAGVAALPAGRKRGRGEGGGSAPPRVHVKAGGVAFEDLEC